MMILAFAGAFLAPAHAADDHDKLYSEYMNLYSSLGHDDDFFRASKRLKDYYLDHNRKRDYYKTCTNEVLYEAEHNRAYHAIELATEMLADLDESGYNAYSLVYTALGAVYESCGNRRMAEHYYQMGLDNIDSGGTGELIALQSRMASLMIFWNPAEAERWNDEYERSSKEYPLYHKAYLFNKAMICFALNDRHTFNETYKRYTEYVSRSSNGSSDYNSEVLETMRLAFDGKYDDALQRLSDPVAGINDITRSNMRSTIYKMMGSDSDVIAEQVIRAELIDSLNSEFYLSNINNLSVQTGVQKAEREASRNRRIMSYIIGTLALCFIALLVYVIVRMRGVREQLKEKNNQLASALSMAEESDRMKTEFVKNVSHEIRTPLNAISGFNDILNTPGIQMSDEERSEVLMSIHQNVSAITGIVDEMLNVAKKESGSSYPCNDTLLCNHYFEKLLYQYRPKVSANVSMEYTTRVMNRMQITTNAEAVNQVLDQLIGNAIKFTRQGTITLHCCKADDMLELSVSDTGTGIADDMKDKVFEQFIKANNTQQGIGLGLTIARRIARKLGGDLTLDKEYRDGARFVFTLPIR